jgi:transcriptional regulator with XRE-family HTH domain
MSRRPYRRRANRRQVNHQLDEWLLAQEISRHELADRMHVTYEYISMVLAGRRTVTDGFLGRFVRTFGWEAAEAVFGGTPEGSEEQKETGADGEQLAFGFQRSGVLSLNKTF